MSDFKQNAPGWVKLSLWGIQSRGAAMFFVILSLVASVLCFFFYELWAVVAFLIAAALYWLALRWVDRNGGWGD